MGNQRAVFEWRRLQFPTRQVKACKNRHSRMWKMHREPEAEAQVGKWLDCRATITSKQLASLHSVKNGILQNACSTRSRVDADLEKSALMPIARLMNCLARSLKIMVTKVQWLHWRIHDSWVAYFYDVEPPKSTTILRKSSNMQKPIRCVRFTKAVVRHANIRDQYPSLGTMCPGDSHQLNTNWGSVSGRDGMASARCPWSSVEAGQKCVKIKGAWNSNILLTFGKKVPACINS